MQDPKKSPKITIWAPSHNFVDISYYHLPYIFATKACIDNRKKLVKQQYLLYTSPQYGELRPTSSWDRFVSLGHPCKFQLVSRLGSVTAGHSSSGRQPNFAALNRGRHLCSVGRPSGWALAHILVDTEFPPVLHHYCIASRRHPSSFLTCTTRGAYHHT